MNTRCYGSAKLVNRLCRFNDYLEIEDEWNIYHQVFTRQPSPVFSRAWIIAMETYQFY